MSASDVVNTLLPEHTRLPTHQDRSRPLRYAVSRKQSVKANGSNKDMGKARTMLKKAYPRVTGVLPLRAASALDTLLESQRTWGGPLNGQNGRQHFVRDLVFTLDVKQFIETGTFRGGTTEFFANLLGAPVFTVEAQPRYHHFAQRRLAQYPWVTAELGDSRDFLRRLAARDELTMHRTLFYLDAHWEHDLPLHEEVEIVADAWSQAVIVIDDFEIPGDAGYAFDDYGPGKRITADYLPDLHGWALFYPVIGSADETGPRRGTGVLVSPELVNEVEEIHTLRRAAQ
jgi:predicted O-methyltransferase YrrM